MIENKKNNADKINNTLTPMINNYLEKINKHSEPLSHAWTTDITEIVTTITIRTSTFGAIRRW